jgi:hypothetical protein
MWQDRPLLKHETSGLFKPNYVKQNKEVTLQTFSQCVPLSVAERASDEVRAAANELYL